MAKTITDKQRDDLLRSRGFNLSSSSNEKRHVTNEEKYKLLRSRGFDLEMASSERQKDDMYRRYGQSASEFWDSIPRKTKNNVSAVSGLISNPNNNRGYFDMLAKEQAEKSIYGSHYSDAKNAEYDLAAAEKRMGEIAEGARNRSGGSVNEITGAFRAAEADELAAQFYIDYGKKYGDYGANIDAASVQRGIKTAPAFQDYLSAEASGMPMNEAQILAMYINADDKTRKNIEMSLVGSEAIVGNARHLTAKQKEVYNAILGEKGAEAARQYIEDSKPLLSSQKYQAEKAEALKYGNEHKGQAFFSTALAAPASGLDYITSLTDYVAGPREVQLDNEGNVFSLADYRTEIRNQALSNIANNANSKLQATVGQFLYSTAASMADNVVNQVAGGEVGSLVLMGMSAANDAYEDAKARGMNEGDALIKGAVSGGIEALTEKVGIDNLFNTFRAGGGATFTSFIKEMLKQGGIEAAEEFTSNLANLAYAALAEGDNAAFRQRYNELISQGETESKAAGMVAGELVQEALTDALGGFVSGGIMSGGAQTIGRAMGYGGSGHYTTDIQTQQALLDEAKELGGKAASLAEKYQTQLDSGKALSKSQYETLVDANDSIIAKTEKAQPQSRLKEAAGKVAAQNAAKKLGAVNAQNTAQNAGGVNAQAVQNNAGASVITPEMNTIAAPAVNVENRNIDTDAVEAAKKAGAELAAMGDTFTESARDGFREGYSPVSESGERVSVKEYTAAFNTLVNAITSGRGIEKATQSIRGIVGEKNLGTVMMAAEYQVMDTQLKSSAAANTKAQAEINKLKAKYAGGAVRTEGKVTFADGAAVQAVSKEESNQIKIMQAHARVFGTNIKITRTLEENGNYDAKTNTITIALDADNALIKVAAHELTHFIARWSPGKYQTLVDFLKDYYNGKKEGSFNRMVRDKQNAYSAQKKHISYNDAVEEVVADASELFLGVGITDGEYINIAREIRDTDKALYEKIGEFISDAAELTSAAGEIGEASSREAARLTADREAFSRAEKLWYEAMADASETSAALNGEMQGKGIKHSLNPNFEVAGAAKEAHADKTRYSFRDTQSGMANDALKPYAQEMRGLIETKGDVIVDSFSKLKEVVNRVFDEPKSKGTAYFGIISNDVLKEIEDSVENLPANLDKPLFKENRNYSIAATFDSIRHMVDKKKLTREDVIDYLDRMPDTIIDRDSVFFSHYVDAFNNRLKGLRFKKSFQDGTLIGFNIISRKKMSLNMQTLFLERSDYMKKKFAETLLMHNTSAHTPKAGAGQTSNLKISHPEDGVKNSLREITHITEARAFSDSDYLSAVERGDMEKDGENIAYTFKRNFQKRKFPGDAYSGSSGTKELSASGKTFAIDAGARNTNIYTKEGESQQNVGKNNDYSLREGKNQFYRTAYASALNGGSSPDSARAYGLVLSEADAFLQDKDAPRAVRSAAARAALDASENPLVCFAADVAGESFSARLAAYFRSALVPAVKNAAFYERMGVDPLSGGRLFDGIMREAAKGLKEAAASANSAEELTAAGRALLSSPAAYDVLFAAAWSDAECASAARRLLDGFSENPFYDAGIVLREMCGRDLSSLLRALKYAGLRAARSGLGRYLNEHGLDVYGEAAGRLIYVDDEYSRRTENKRAAHEEMVRTWVDIAGQSAYIDGIISTDGGKVKIRLTDGRIADMSEVLFNTSAPGLRSRLSELYSNAAGLDAKTADAFVKGWDMSLPVRLYEAGFREMLSLAKDGVPFDKAIQGKYAFLLSRSAQQSAYSAGKKLAATPPSVIDTYADDHKEQVSYDRPSGYRKGVREQVWQNAKNKNGYVIDPVTKRVIDPNKPWDMGHKPGYEFKKHQKSAHERGISRKQFLDEHNNPQHYRPELPKSNRSHVGEDVTNNYLGY